MERYILYISLALSILAVIFFLIQNFRLNKLAKKYRKFMQGLGNKDVENLMTSYLNELETLKNNVLLNVNKRLEEVEKKMPRCVRHIGIVNYDAFDNVANKMSFSAAILDDRKNGFVITGIYSRDFAYVYTKEIIGGVPQKELSKEEIDALNKALNE